jgi:hypothetical protein
LNSPDPPFSFILPNMPLPPFQEQFQKVLVFHLHTCGHRPGTPTPFLNFFPLPLVPIPSTTWSTLLFLIL